MREIRLKKRLRRTVHTLGYSDNVKRLHPRQALLQLLDKDSERCL